MHFIFRLSLGSEILMSFTVFLSCACCLNLLNERALGNNNKKLNKSIFLAESK